jgi:hypothetical protein
MKRGRRTVICGREGYSARERSYPDTMTDSSNLEAVDGGGHS